MANYIFKTYILEGREYFVYGVEHTPFEHTDEIIKKTSHFWKVF